MNSAAPAWTLAGPQSAKLQCGPLAAIAACKPDGIQLVPSSWNGRAIVAGSVEVLSGNGSAELKVSDFYIRESDLVAEFSHAGRDVITPHVYWRATSIAAGARIELVVSVRTDLLDS